jgi:hypothetical protein
MSSSIIQSIYVFCIHVYVYNTSPTQFTTFQRVQDSYYHPQQSSVMKPDTSNPQRIMAVHESIHSTISHVCYYWYRFYTHIMRDDYPFYYSPPPPPPPVPISLALSSLKQFPAPCLSANLCYYQHTRTPPYISWPTMLKWWSHVSFYSPLSLIPIHIHPHPYSY